MTYKITAFTSLALLVPMACMGAPHSSMPLAADNFLGAQSKGAVDSMPGGMDMAASDQPVTRTNKLVTQPTLNNEPKMTACDPDAVQFAIGQVATPSLIEDIKQRSKAQFARVLPEGAGATRDYIASRINIQLDRANRIAAIRCG